MAVRMGPALVLILALFAGPVPPVDAQQREQRILENAAAVMDDTMSLRLQAIPHALLADAEGIAIIPSVIKGGFVVGARHGKGVLLVRDDRGAWELPVFISLTGGNIGWQIGVQSTDLILVFKTRKSIEGILQGKLTLGADAAAAAGPVGRQAAAATDGRLRAEIYSYSRSRGLFAGVSVDGSVLRVEPGLNAACYGQQKESGEYYAPPAAVALAQKVADYCYQPGMEDPELPTGQERLEQALPPASSPLDPAAVLRRQLAGSARSLQQRLDPQWISYLAIPPEILSGESVPAEEAIQRSLDRFASVADDPNYTLLSGREEFSRTFTLLQEYQQFLERHETASRLPPPPIVTEAEAPLLR